MFFLLNVGHFLSISRLDITILKFFLIIKFFLAFQWSCKIFSVYRFAVLRPLVKHWRSQAVNIVVYSDDGMAVCLSRHECDNIAKKKKKKEKKKVRSDSKQS